MAGPLEGVRVLDLTSVLMGPYASRVIADMGAEVIKVESPLGDPTRTIGPMRHPGMGPIFLHANRGKRSLVLDLKKPEGHQALLRLVPDVDVLLYNLRPQAMARLGLSHEVLADINPRLIYAGTFGFGQRGRYAARPAYDDLIQGAVGLPSLIQQAGSDVPRYVPSNIADRTVGLYAVASLCAALYHRERTGRGQRIDIPMFETMVSHLVGDHVAGETFDPAQGPTGYARLLARHRRPYRTRDGHVCAVIYSDRHWAAFLEMVGRGELMTTDARLADLATRTRHMDELQALVSGFFPERSTAAWLELLGQADIPCMPLHTVDSLFDDPHLQDEGFFQWTDHPSEGRIRTIGVPADWSDSQPQPGRPAPRFGEHSREILLAAGYSQDEVAALEEKGATRLAQQQREQ